MRLLLTTSPNIPDPSICAQEQIQIPGSIESHGALVVVSEVNSLIVQASANTGDILGRPVEQILGSSLSELLQEDSLSQLWLEAPAYEIAVKPYRLPDIRVKGQQRTFQITLHRLPGLLVIEFEPAQRNAAPLVSTYVALTNTLAVLRGVRPLSALCQRAAEHVRHITGFDRVMIYRFLEDDTGVVIAESRREDLTPYLGLHYPASDIPAQARLLYLRNPIRIKPDVYAPSSALVPQVNPITGGPLDMSYCILRRMSPVHDEYLRNMGVTASVSLSIVKGQRLWGLVACHHATPHFLSHAARIACEFLAEFLSSQIAAQDDAEAWDYHARLETASLNIEELLRLQGLQKTLAECSTEIFSSVEADGIAIHTSDGQLTLRGITPPAEDLRKLADWLARTQDEVVFATDCLSREWEGAQTFRGEGSGLLSIRITRGSSDFVIWFRGEWQQVVNWAGNPSKPVEATEQGLRISPRRSFAVWKQTIAGRSKPWNRFERTAATTLSHLFAEAMLIEQKAELDRLNVELARSNSELDSFANAASHDLQEPVRTVGAYAQLLQRREIFEPGSFAHTSLELMVHATQRMSNLIEGLLEYARLGGAEKSRLTTVSLEDTLQSVILNLKVSIQQQSAVIEHTPLPQVEADAGRVEQLLQNLISNSLKYRSTNRPFIQISAERLDAYWQISVSDNGVGFDTQHSQMIFKPFKRLHGSEIPGSGLGLAICQRIVEQHGGSIQAQSTPGTGTTFSFTLPHSAACQ